MDKKGSYKKILTALYDAQRQTDDLTVLKNISKAAWELGVKLDIDTGFHELSELIEGRVAGRSEGNEHYEEVIRRHLS